MDERSWVNLLKCQGLHLALSAAPRLQTTQWRGNLRLGTEPPLVFDRAPLLFFEMSNLVYGMWAARETNQAETCPSVFFLFSFIYLFIFFHVFSEVS